MSILFSIGIDIGTSTTEIILSKLTITSSLGSSLLPITSIEKKEIIYRSPIAFTPMVDENIIDFTKVKTLIEDALIEAGVLKDDIQTGAVIITGETARKENSWKRYNISRMHRAMSRGVDLPRTI